MERAARLPPGPGPFQGKIGTHHIYNVSGFQNAPDAVFGQGAETLGACRVADFAEGGAAGDELFMLAAQARSGATDAALFATRECIQQHGGVGFTWEFDPHLFFRRAQASSQRMGTVEQWREQIAARLLDEPEEQVAEAA